MNYFQNTNVMKNLFLLALVGFALISCGPGDEKKTQKTQETTAQEIQPVKDSGKQSVTTNHPGVMVSGREEKPARVEIPPAAPPSPEQVNAGQEKHQTVHLHPVKRDPNDPNNKLLNAYTKNKVNSMVIPFQKGDDPNLKASRDFYMNGSRKAGEGDNEGAIDDFTKSLALVKNASVYMRRGYCYLLLQDYQSAIIDENEALKMAPVLDKAYFARAICRFEMQDFKNAEEDLNKYMETDKNNALAYNYLAAIKFMQKNFKEALDNYDHVAKLDPSFPDVYTNRGMMRHNLGDLKGAIEDYNLAIRQTPSNSAAYNNKGAAEMTLKDYPAALNDLNTAIKIKEDYADAYDNRGKVKLKMGDQQGACDDWQKALSLGLQSSRDLIMKFCK
jgi:tetratricopeptide (TPR) repeat protein